MNFSVPEGTTVIGYSGSSNEIPAWRIAKAISEQSNGKAFYITKLPAGELLNTSEFKNALKKVVGDEKVSKLISGCRVEIDLETGDEREECR